MTIERYSFNLGVALTPDRDTVSETAKIIVANRRTKQLLPAGEYDITPEIWRKYASNSSRYNLIVFPDGTATLRLLPVDMDVVTTVISAQGMNTKGGGRTFSIPDDAELVPIIGPKKGDPTCRVYEIIYYVPGLSPMR